MVSLISFTNFYCVYVSAIGFCIMTSLACTLTNMTSVEN